MLGIRTAPKEDLNCSAVEMVFRSTLTVPGEFISPSHRQHDAPTTKFFPTNTKFHGNSKCAPIKPLDTAAFVFVRVDRHKTPPCRPYERPFRVIRKGDKTFTIARKNKKEVISMDRLKPAYLENHINPPCHTLTGGDFSCNGSVLLICTKPNTSPHTCSLQHEI